MYPAIVPYLLVPDGAAELDFLERAFGAEEKLRVPGNDGRGVMHAEITVGSGLVMLAEPPSADASSFLPPDGLSAVGIMVRVATPAEVERLYGQALQAGGTSDVAPRDEPWGARFAGIRDPAGHRWWLHAPLG